MTRPLWVVAGIHVREGRLLLCRRHSTGDFPGLWEFPGGKVEADETPEDALMREWREELGVTPLGLVPHSFATSSNLAASSNSGAATGFRRFVTLLFFRVRAMLGEPAALDCEAVRWSTPEEARILPMPPADLPVLAGLPVRGDDPGLFEDTSDGETPELLRSGREREPFIFGSEELSPTVPIRFTKRAGASRPLEAILVQTDAGPRAYLNLCPHVPVPLDRGEDDFVSEDGKLLVCRKHGALFAPESGLCVSGPCRGDSLQPVQIEPMGAGWAVRRR
ncbi:MAG: NUDIX domain-containing protein [Thermoanaerobaculia bacterium]